MTTIDQHGKHDGARRMAYLALVVLLVVAALAPAGDAAPRARGLADAIAAPAEAATPAASACLGFAGTQGRALELTPAPVRLP